MSKLGQHFLKSKNILQIIADAVSVGVGVDIVEIGPGKGALTEYLLKKDRRVIAIEKDPALFDLLSEKFEKEIEEKKLILQCSDVRDFEAGKTPYAVISNIPYYLTSSVIKSFLERDHPPETMTLMIQKEVAERIARRGGKESLLSLSVQLFGDVKYIKTVSNRFFSPKPKVDSAVITITNINPPKKETQNVFFETIHTAFREKRKCVLKKFKDKTDVFDLLVKKGVTKETRAEDVPFEVWRDVARDIIDL